MANTESCKGCGASVRIPEKEIERLLRAYLSEEPDDLADPALHERRLSICTVCQDLLYGTTCRHCGCLTPIMVRVKSKHCPNPRGSKW